MKPRFSILVIAIVLLITAPLIAYTINLDTKSGVELTQEQQKVLSDPSPSVRVDIEEKMIKDEIKKDMQEPTKNIIYLNGQRSDKWPK